MSTMTAHDHAEPVEGCFRCDLSRDEVRATTPLDRAAEAFGEHRSHMFDCACGASFGHHTSIVEASKDFRRHMLSHVLTAALHDPANPDALAKAICRQMHPTRWEFRTVRNACDHCLRTDTVVVAWLTEGRE